ncbi:MAG: hypothetical protein AAGC46_01865 [Solirubrobacteraceae bacterium]|nr:hypothetical protein [Patulibacter sp.]
MQRGRFIELLGSGEPRLEPLLLSLSSDLGHVAGDGAGLALGLDRAVMQIDRLAATLVGVDSLPPAVQLQMLSSAVLVQFRVGVQPCRPDFGDLRPDVVLAELAGHPVVVAAVVAMVAQRAGLPIAVVIGDHSVLLAHREQVPPLAISVDRRGEVLDARTLEDPRLSWRCAHELSALLLDLVVARADELQLRPVWVRACELATALPLDPHGVQRRGDDLRRAQAVWN